MSKTYLIFVLLAAGCQGCAGDVYLEELGVPFRALDAEEQVVEAEVRLAVEHLKAASTARLEVQVRYVPFTDYRRMSRVIICGPTEYDPDPCPGRRAWAWTWVAESYNGDGRLAQITLPITGLLPGQWRPLLVHELIHATLYSIQADGWHEHTDVTVWGPTGMEGLLNGTH